MKIPFIFKLFVFLLERIFVALKNNCMDILLLMWESKL